MPPDRSLVDIDVVPAVRGHEPILDGDEDYVPIAVGADGEVARRVPRRARSWYLVCRSADVRPGAVVGREVAGRPVAIYRERGGALHALSAHCAHMGAHLGGGTVTGDRLRCPLHGWEYDGQGVCRHSPGLAAPPAYARQRAYPVAERYGGVFVFDGPEPLFPPPAFSTVDDAELRVGYGRPVRLACPWFALAANAFDGQHLQTVHQRILHAPPEVAALDRYRLQLRYVSRVAGQSPADRAIRRLSRDRIAVTITCWGGTVLTIESDLGRTRGALLVGLQPDGNATVAQPVVGVRRTGAAPADALRVAVSRWLYSAFLGRDVAILDDMRFRARLPLPEGEPLAAFLDYLHGLPAAPR